MYVHHLLTSSNFSGITCYSRASQCWDLYNYSPIGPKLMMGPGPKLMLGPGPKLMMGPGPKLMMGPGPKLMLGPGPIGPG